MVSGTGHIELERAIDSITVGNRHRADLGDLDAMVASIQRKGLLQPITITPEGVLVCGSRRLAALRMLGVKTVNVWVRSGITDRLGQLLAEQDDNALHKPLTQTEAATLYRELKTLLAEDAARRQEASRFTARPEADGGANVAPPSSPAGKARAQAAQMVTGRNSYTTLERVNHLQALAANPNEPDSVRATAAAELERIDTGGGVISAFQRVGAEKSLTELERIAADVTAPAPDRDKARAEVTRLRTEESTTRAAELERLATDALARVRAEGRKKPRTKAAAASPGVQERRTLRAFVLTWDDLADWWEHYDSTEVGTSLSDEQWDRFTAAVEGTLAFAEAAGAARRQSKQRTA